MLQRTPENPILTTTFGTVPERFGSLRLCVVDLVCDMIETQNLNVAEALCKSAVLPLILDHFFRYDWHNLLHCCLLRIMTSVLHNNSRDAHSQEATHMIRRHLLGPTESGGCGLLQRMLDVYEEKCPPDAQEPPTDELEDPDDTPLPGRELEKKLVAASSACGYMNVVLEAALMVNELPEFIQELDSDELCTRWAEFDLAVLQPLKGERDECLGGGVPPQSAAPPCSQM
eukprot:TRINITY_DN13271_c0_g1_i2.p1 TRINITY_DN13271_c0_g1~~TRINITY_DN13271_c0_g1_i2.p1  ORF type:complete len:229 (+),score=59.93 TRINITY_DN13271_c0_g1_i2:201-887(+)